MVYIDITTIGVHPSTRMVNGPTLITLRDVLPNAQIGQPANTGDVCVSFSLSPRPTGIWSDFSSVSMAGAWHGGLTGAEEYRKDANLESAIFLGMRWWFDRDFTNLGCLYNGGSASCPCDSAETLLWNPNWFSNVGIALRNLFRAKFSTGDRSTAPGGRYMHDYRTKGAP